MDPLTRSDFQTRTWDRLEAHMQKRLAELREENDGRLDEVKTTHVRGRIAELKELLALAVEPAPATSGPGNAFDAFPGS